MKPARAVSWARAARRLAGGLLAAGLLTAPAFVWPDSYGTLARRFLMPWADIDRISRFVVTVAPGDKVLAVGSDLTVTASVRPRFGIGPTPDAAWLEWTAEGDASPQRVAMPLAIRPRSGESTGFVPAAVRVHPAEPRPIDLVSGRHRRGREPSAPDHDARATGRHGDRGPGRAAGLYKAPGLDRPGPGPDRRDRRQSHHARHHAQPARPLDRSRMAEANGNEARSHRRDPG